ncbi:MAG: HlyD family type I secretion periplasmic adaptor subunit [Beijerinckiaceae bacterium]|nr:HlyD family type I secretion periplasmic adaptor subunit [Beijerinckiaceae bacterium]
MARNKDLNGRDNFALSIGAPPRERSFRIGRHVTAGIVMTVFLIGVCGSWAALARLEGAVIGQGALKVNENLKEVQHRDGGIVDQISVRQGDHVEKGQILLRFDDVQIRAELSITNTQLGELLARRVRLVAERDNVANLVFPDELSGLLPEVATTILGESLLFNGNKLHRESQKQQLAFSIEQTGEELRGLEARRSAKADEIGIVEAERQKLSSLLKQGLISSARVHAINVEWIRLRGEAGEIDAAIARAKVRISEARLQIITVDQTARTDAQRELRQVDARVSELSDRKVAIEDRLSRVDVRAPISGWVNELTVFTVGGVVTPAARMMTIVPDKADLRVEVKLAPADIDQVRTGQRARLRFTAFNRNTTPEVSGDVVHISPSVTRDAATGQMHYVGEVQFTADAAKLGDRKLLPGMPVEVFIATEERTPLSYFVKPFTDQFERTFRER